MKTLLEVFFVGEPVPPVTNEQRARCSAPVEAPALLEGRIQDPTPEEEALHRERAAACNALSRAEVQISRNRLRQRNGLIAGGVVLAGSYLLFPRASTGKRAIAGVAAYALGHSHGHPAADPYWAKVLPGFRV